MDELKNALPPEGSTKCAQKRELAEESMGRYRRNLLLTLGFCLLLADALNWPWGMGNTATVFAWYLLLALTVGREGLFRRRESRVLLGVNLALASTFALTSNPLFRWWNFLALAALVPLHAVSGLGARPWWDAGMLTERCGLFFQGLFGNLWACFAAAIPERRKAEKKEGGGRTLTVVLGICGAVALVSFLIPVLASADALFAASLERLNWWSLLFRLQVSDLGGVLRRLFWALVFTPFVFSLLYAMAHPKLLCPAEEKKGFQADALGFVLALAAVDGLYLSFLAVQSAGLFGGPEYVEGLGVSYADWARSGFFQMVGVTVVNLSLTLAAMGLSRREGRDWTVLRILCGVLVGESLVLLASAAWRMTLYISAYGLSFKRCMTYWGMGMMALFLLAGLWKIRKPDFRFCKWAFPAALAGWLLINCVPVDYLVAKNQVDRYLSGESPVVSVQYLLYSLSYDTISQLERLDGERPVSDYTGDSYWRREETLAEVLRGRRLDAQWECANWRGWNLSACIQAGGRYSPLRAGGFQP